MWWILGGVIQPIAAHTKPWLRHLSFNYNLQQIGLASFRLGDDFKTAQDNIPILGEMLAQYPPQTMDALNHPRLGRRAGGLAVDARLAGRVWSSSNGSHPNERHHPGAGIEPLVRHRHGAEQRQLRDRAGADRLGRPQRRGQEHPHPDRHRPASAQFRPADGFWRSRPGTIPPLLRRIGYCPEGEAVPKELRPIDWLRGLALLSGLPHAEAGGRCEAILDKVKLPREHWGKRMGQYSKGMKQRVKLAQGLLHRPELAGAR